MLRPSLVVAGVSAAGWRCRCTAEAVLDVDSCFGEQRLESCGAREESGKGEGVRELAVGGDEVGIRRQDRPVDHRLGGGERGAVERCEPGDDGVDEGIQLGVGQGAGDPAPSFGGGCVVVGAGEDDLQCAVTTDGARKPLRAATTGQQATADLGLPEDRLLTAGVAQVECECEVTAAPGAASDGCDGDVGPCRISGPGWSRPAPLAFGGGESAGWVGVRLFLVVREDDAVLDVGQGRQHVVDVDGGREPRQPVRERRDLLAGEEGRPRGCVFEAED